MSSVKASRGLRVDVSAGIACYPDEASTREELVAIADGMLYLAKRGIALSPPQRR